MNIFRILLEIYKSILCKHDFEFVRNIYGDQIRYNSWNRSMWKCKKCGKLKYKQNLFNDDYKQE